MRTETTFKSGGIKGKNSMLKCLKSTYELYSNFYAKFNVACLIVRDGRADAVTYNRFVVPRFIFTVLTVK